MAVAIGAAIALTTGSSQAQNSAPQSCASQTAFHALDFWVGTWRVTSGGVYAGTDVVTSELGGDAPSSSDGPTPTEPRHESLSLRFVYRTMDANVGHRPGNARGRAQIQDARRAISKRRHTIQGILPALPGKKPILDRTTLTPMQDGRSDS